MSKNNQFIFKGIFSIVLVGFLIGAIGLDNLLAAISLISIPTLIILIILALATLTLNVIAVWALYRTVIPISFNDFAPAFLASWAAGFFLPGKIGSLSITILLREKVKPGVSAAIFILDKVITVILALIIGSFFLMQFLDPAWWVLPVLLLVIGLTGVGIIFFTEQGRSFLRWMLGSRSTFFEGFSESLPIFYAKPKGIVFNALLTLARSGAQSISLVLLFSSLGHKVTWENTLALSSIENLAALIPITLSGIGLREVVLGTLSTQLQIPFSLGVSAGLIMTLIMLMIVIPGVIAFDEKKLLAHSKK